MNFINSLTVYGDAGLFLLRLSAAVIFLYHGLPKLGKAKMMAQGMGMPAGMIFLLGLIESLSALGLIFGILIPAAALILSIVMVGAIYFKMAKWHIPFAAMDKTGWEFDLILLGANLAILLTGGGAIFR